MTYIRRTFLIALVAITQGITLFGQVKNRNPYNLPLIQTVDAYNRQVKDNPAMQMADMEKADPRIRKGIANAQRF